MNTPVDHPEFTALAIGETIDPTVAREISAALRQDTAARQEAAELHAAAASLRQALMREAQPGLDEVRRRRVLEATPGQALELLGAGEEEAVADVVPLRFSRNHPAPSQARIWLGVAAGAAVFIMVARLIPTGKSPIKPEVDPMADAVRLSTPGKVNGGAGRVGPAELPSIVTAPAVPASPESERSAPLPPLPRVAPASGLARLPVSPAVSPELSPPAAAPSPADSRAYSSPATPGRK